MRTTINIDAELLAAAKKLAINKKSTLREVIEDALRAALSRPEPSTARPFKLVTFRGDGPNPGINLDKTSELIELEDIERMGRSRP